jgi:electron transfer flavoprotein beta subunit
VRHNQVEIQPGNTEKARLKIVVTVKQIPDPNSVPKLTSDNRLVRDGEVVLDPGDEYGVEAALRIKEAGGEAEVVLVSMGPAKAADAIRKGLSMGADRAIHINDDALAGADALTTAQVLAAAISGESPDLVVCGTESTDSSTGMVPPMLAEFLGFPQLTFAKQVEVSGGKVKIQRQTDVGYDVVESDTPALITVTAGVGEPRYASLKGIMAARSKEVKKIALADLGVSRGKPAEEVLDVADAEQRQAGEVIEDDGSAVEKIVALLVKVKAV